MDQTHPAIRLTGGMCLRHGRLCDAPLSLERGRITDTAGGRDIDVSGHIVLPGIVDLRSSGWRGMLGDGPMGRAALTEALARNARALVRGGTSSAWISAPCLRTGPARDPWLAETIIATVQGIADRAGLRAAPRLEIDTHMTDQTDRATALIAQGAVAHLGLVPVASQMQDLRDGDPETVERLIAQVARQKPLVPRHLFRLAEACTSAGIGFSSLHDPDAETREYLRMLGSGTADAPLTAAAAGSAAAIGDAVLIEASDAIASPRHQTWIADGLVSALVSGDMPSAMLRAVFALEARGITDLAGAWALVAENPARIMGARDRGTLIAGNRADLVILDARTRHVAATLVGGRLVWGRGHVATDLSGLSGGRLAAE